MPHLTAADVRFAVAVAHMAEGLLGAAAGADVPGECPLADPECAASAFGDHRWCLYELAPCTDPDDGCPPAARAIAGDAR